MRHGQISALQCNMNRDEKIRPTPYKAIEFMNFIEEPPERELTSEEIDFHIDRMLGV